MFKVNGLFENESTSNTIFNIIKGKKIIEIGGPSMNNYWIPIFYSISAFTDFINFSNENNISLHLGCGWNNNLPENCKFIQSNNIEEFVEKNLNKYDIVLTSHVLEHQANSIKQLLLWKKLINKDGMMIHVLPEKEHTSDYFRPITTFDKLLSKFKNNVTEDDISEIDEIIKYTGNRHLYDKTIILTPDEINHSIKALEYYKLNPYIIEQTRPIHHHVYDFSLLNSISKYIDMEQFLFFNISIDNWVFWKSK